MERLAAFLSQMRDPKGQTCDHPAQGAFGDQNCERVDGHPKLTQGQTAASTNTFGGSASSACLYAESVSDIPATGVSADERSLENKKTVPPHPSPSGSELGVRAESQLVVDELVIPNDGGFNT
eukprot:5414924-Amphidinium_carterae.2